MPFDIPLPWEQDLDEEERKRREALALSEAIAVEEDQTGARSPLRDVPIEPVRTPPDPIAAAAKQFFSPVTNVAAGALGGVAELPWAGAAGAIAIPSAIDRAIGDTNRMSARGTMRPAWMPPVDESQNVTPEWLLSQGKGADRTIKEALGVPAEPGGYAYLEQKIGQSITPAKKMTTAATGLISGVNILADYLRHPSEEPGLTQDEAQRRELGQPKPKSLTVPEWLSSAVLSTAEAAPKKRWDQMLDPNDATDITGKPLSSDARRRRLEKLNAARAEEGLPPLDPGQAIPRRQAPSPFPGPAAPAPAPGYNPADTWAIPPPAPVLPPSEEPRLQGQVQFVTPEPGKTVVETQGGPTKVTNAELYTLGGIVIGSLGMAFGPRVYHSMKFEPAVKFRPVVHAPENTYTISNLGDLVRTYDDANAGLLRIAQRAGVEPDVLHTLETKLSVGSRSATQSAADAAVTLGEMRTTTFHFSTKTPIGKMRVMEETHPDLSNYAHLRDTMDDINMAESTTAFMKQQAAAGKGTAPPPGPTIIRGQDKPTVLSEIYRLEQKDPELRVIHSDYRNYMRDVRHYEAEGEWGTISKAEEAARNSGRYGHAPGETVKAGPNEVPWYGMGKQTGDPIDRGSFSVAATEATRIRIAQRIENETKGTFIDAVNAAHNKRLGGHGQIGHNQPPVGSSLFTKVTEEEWRKNPSWHDNTVTVRRRGVQERWVTDPFIADMLNLDPYYFQGMGANAFFNAKRLLEVGATGYLAPWFAATSFLRNWQIAKFTTPQGFRSPGLLRSAYAIVQQLDPQLSRAISISLDRGSAGLVGKMFGQANVQALSKRLARDYDNSLFHIMQTAGTHKGSILEQQQAVRGSMANLMKSVDGITDPFTKSLWRGYTNLLSAMHNAPAFAFASKNRGRGGISDVELTLKARQLTGDPRTAGQYYRGGTNKPIRFQPTDTLMGAGGRADLRLAKFYGGATEIGRNVIPWYNATTQGIKRVGQAYLENPSLFIGRLWLYQIMPSGLAYMMSRALGNDPNGRSYADYHINGRGDWDKTMNLYIPIPGLPAEHGVKIPRFHEVSIAGRLTEAAMDHIFRASNPIFSEKESFMQALKSYVDIAIMPPAPPFHTWALASQGFASPGGMFGEPAYRMRNDPYDSTKGMDGNIAQTLRAVAGGIGEITGAGYAAFTQTPERSESYAFTNALKQAGTRAVTKTPGLRDVLGMHAPMAGNTNISEELFKKQHVINDLARFYQTWGLLGDKDINTKWSSKKGGALAEEKLREAGDILGGKPLSPVRTGLGQDVPGNPLYLESAKMIWNKFKKDAPVTDPKELPGRDDLVDPRDPEQKPLSQTKQAKERREEKQRVAQQRWDAALDEGGGPMGFKSLWHRHANATAKIRDLQNANYGNLSTWQLRLSQRDPEGLKELTSNNVDPSDPNAVRNFYTRIRHDTGRVILQEIRKVEAELSAKYGRPVKLEDLDPHKPPAWYISQFVSPF